VKAVLSQPTSVAVEECFEQLVLACVCWQHGYGALRVVQPAHGDGDAHVDATATKPAAVLGKVNVPLKVGCQPVGQGGRVDGSVHIINP